ncbi:helix-turn-helix domain-containing protein [Lysobacter sp. Root494]|uniref:helix-turn-helix transcriptional regulator n=1 Tax=Lysobacter sp. Root494 TaxID=1736549 RepID=UPI000AEDA731|nr:helix-turn-helix domain-containing protein [Lysobacter sp. Root494]
MQTDSHQPVNTPKTTEFDRLLPRQEFCDRYGLNYRTVEGWAHLGIGPKVTRLGARAYYHVDDINEWVEAQRKKASARFSKKGAQ